MNNHEQFPSELEARHHIDVSGGDPNPMPIEVNRGEVSALQTRLDTTVYKPHSPDKLADRREKKKPSRVRQALVGAVATTAILGGLHEGLKRDEARQKTQTELTQPIRDNVADTIQVNEHFQAGQDQNQVPAQNPKDQITNP